MIHSLAMQYHSQYAEFTLNKKIDVPELRLNLTQYKKRAYFNLITACKCSSHRGSKSRLKFSYVIKERNFFLRAELHTTTAQSAWTEQLKMTCFDFK